MIGGRYLRNCVAMVNRKWVTYPCSFKLGYVCQRRAGTLIIPLFGDLRENNNSLRQNKYICHFHVFILISVRFVCACVCACVCGFGVTGMGGRKGKATQKDFESSRKELYSLETSSFLKGKFYYERVALSWEANMMLKQAFLLFMKMAEY